MLGSCLPVTVTSTVELHNYYDVNTEKMLELTFYAVADVKYDEYILDSANVENLALA